MTMTNKERARAASYAVSQCTDYKTDIYAEQSVYIVDLLANLRHLCDQEVYDFDLLLDKSLRTFQADLDEENL
jgi:hypothetical protein